MNGSLADGDDGHARRPPVVPGVADVDWTRAGELPPCVSAVWRDAARWRAHAAERAAGARHLHLPGFVARDAAQHLRAEVEALSFARMDTDLVHAERRLLSVDELPTWRAFMRHEVTRLLFGALLGRPMPEGLVVNAWRLSAGDHMGEHPDGPRYFGTISLGLNEGWNERDGGAIAFRSGQRWFPQLGDVCVFAPADDTWHRVEAVKRGVRLSVTGWWVREQDAL